MVMQGFHTEEGRAEGRVGTRARTFTVARWTHAANQQVLLREIIQLHVIQASELGFAINCRPKYSTSHMLSTHRGTDPSGLLFSLMVPACLPQAVEFMTF